MTFKVLKSSKKGMTLLEVMIAAFILAIVAMPIINLFVASTKYLTVADNMGNTTYTGEAVIEDLYPLGYYDLFNFAPLQGVKSNYQIKSVVNSSTVYVTKPVTIDRTPYGAFNNLVSGTACYAHLIINGNTATFTCPDGTMHSGIALSSTAISMTSTQITIGGNTWNLNKPAGTTLILIINAGSAAITPAITINLPSGGSVYYVLYALSTTDSHTQNITVSNGNAASKEYRKYNSTNDPPPSYMLVNAICKVYAADGSVESMVQDTLKADLP